MTPLLNYDDLLRENSELLEKLEDYRKRHLQVLSLLNELRTEQMDSKNMMDSATENLIQIEKELEILREMFDFFQNYPDPNETTDYVKMEEFINRYRRFLDER